MESLGYTQSQAAYEAAMGIEYDLSAWQVNWRAIPNSAWLGLLAAGVLCAALSAPKPALALSVDTPSGACLNARYGPGTDYGVYTCVMDGAPLVAASGRTQGNWVELETGRWVYGPYTSEAPASGNPGVGVGGRIRVNTPGGSCLNARYGPTVESGVYACVVNGAILKPVVDTDITGEWLELSSGRWVYGAYTTYNTGGRVGGGEFTYTETLPLQRGDRGEAVSTLQRTLVSNGYSIGAAGVDGLFGDSTAAAVRRFQADQGLAVDGIVGPVTKDAMGLTLPGEGA